jgi:hypothetical protein
MRYMVTGWLSHQLSMVLTDSAEVVVGANKGLAGHTSTPRSVDESSMMAPEDPEN